MGLSSSLLRPTGRIRTAEIGLRLLPYKTALCENQGLRTEHGCENKQGVGVYVPSSDGHPVESAKPR